LEGGTGRSPAPTRAAAAPRRCTTLIETAKLNDVDPRAWLADVLARLPGHPARHIDDLLPWNWHSQAPTIAAA
jgi:hypothetical protein